MVGCGQITLGPRLPLQGVYPPSSEKASVITLASDLINFTF